MKRLANADFELFAEMISDVQDKEVDKQTEEDGEFTRKPAGQTENRRLSDVLDRVGKRRKKAETTAMTGIGIKSTIRMPCLKWNGKIRNVSTACSTNMNLQSHKSYEHGITESNRKVALR